MRSKTCRDTVISAEREEKALELRRAGASYRQIAKGLGCSVANSYKLVNRGLSRLIGRCQDEAEHVRTLELDRLDAMLMGLWPAATKGNPQSVEKVLKVMERRACLLGLDKPTKIAPTNPDGSQQWDSESKLTDDELNARISELAGKLGIGLNLTNAK